MTAVKRMVILLAMAIATISMSGCCHLRNVATNTATTDSIATIIHERVVEVHDTAYIEVPVEVYRNVTVDTSILETSFAISEAFVDSIGMLHHSLANKPQTLKKTTITYVPVSDTTHTERHDSQNDQQRTVYVEKPLHWWQEALIRLGAFTLIAGLVFIGITILRKRIHHSS